MRSKLVIRPIIKENESLIGYAMRLAQKNGQTSLSSFFKNIDCPSQHLGFSSIFLEPLVKRLSKCTGHRVSLESTFFDIESKWDWLNSPSICPICIKKDGIHRTEWQYSFDTYCFEHGNDLITRCKTCDKQLAWNIPLLKGICHCCGQDLSNDCTEIRPPISALKIRKLSGNKLTYYIDELRGRIRRQRRPFDLIKEPLICEGLRFEWSKLVRETSEYMERGINLPPAYNLQFHHGCYPVMDEYYLPNFYRFAKETDKQRKEVYDARYYVDVSTLSLYLGLSEYNIRAIINTGIIKDVKRRGWTQSYFDYRDWHGCLKAVQRSNENLISLEDAMTDASMLWSHSIYLFTGILKGRVAVQLSDIHAPSFKNIKIDRASAHFWYRKNAILKNKNSVTVSEAAKIMGRSNNHVYQLIKLDKLESLESNDGFQTVSVESLNGYLENNQTENRISVVTAHLPQ